MYTLLPCGYTIQLAHSLFVHDKPHVKLRQTAPILFLAGDIGDPMHPSFDAFITRCAAKWQRVFVCCGELEARSPLHVSAACRKHANVVLVSNISQDTYLEGLMVCGEAPTEPRDRTVVTLAYKSLCINTELIEQCGTHYAPVTPNNGRFTVQRGCLGYIMYV